MEPRARRAPPQVTAFDDCVLAGLRIRHDQSAQDAKARPKGRTFGARTLSSQSGMRVAHEQYNVRPSRRQREAQMIRPLRSYIPSLMALESDDESRLGAELR